MRKFIITSEMRDLEAQVARGEISYSRMIELINEKADKWHEDKVKKISSNTFVSRCKTFFLKITYPIYFVLWLFWQWFTDEK